MRVLVTGAAGFIGRHIVSALAAAGHEVVSTDQRADADHSWAPADLRDAAAVSRLLDGVDAVCHQAAKVGLGVSLDDLPEYASHNDVGTAVLLAAMGRAGVRTLVLASSMVVYGEGAYRCETHGPVSPGPRRQADLQAGRFEPPCPGCGAPLQPELVDEAAPLDPRNGYAASKVAQEHYAAAWARATGGRVAALRYHNVFGPGMPRDTPYAGVAAIFGSAVARGEAPQVFEDGRMRRDFVHVRDVAGANVAALDMLVQRDAAPAGLLHPEAEPGAGQRPRRQLRRDTPTKLPNCWRLGELRAYNIASGTPRTVGDMAAALARAAGAPEPVVTGRFRLGDVRHITASADRAERELGWAAKTLFAAGMAELVMCR
ncbi:MAG: NAD-dependent epimerase/dehydratase family protein [Nocardioidaceae bacterium]